MASSNPFDTATPPEMPSPKAEQVAVKVEGEIKPDKEIEDIAGFLLDKRLILTCLELHTELLERGQELPQLKDYFSNPGNFEHAIPQPIPAVKSDLIRTPSMSTFDSLELGRCSDDGRDIEERVAVLEFELRKAYDTIKSLRGSLTRASDITNTKLGEEVQVSQSEEPIKPHEKRALNFLVHEYLNETANKLTAITLSDENGDQNLEDWDDVGLNVPKPPSLLQQFRHYDSFSLAGQEQLNRIGQLEKEIQLLNGQNLALKRENESFTLRMKKLSLFDEDIEGQGIRTRGYSTSSSDASRKAFTPDIKQSRPTVSHKRNTSNPFVDVARSLPLDASSPVKNVEKEIPRPPSSPAFISSIQDTPSTLKKEETFDKSSISSDATAHDMTDDIIMTNEKESPQISSTQAPLTESPKISSTEVPLIEDSGTMRQHMSLAFRQELLSVMSLKTDSIIFLEIAKLADPQLDIMALFSRCLPEVVNNTLLPKREGLIPVLLCVINHHSDHRERDKLLNMLFNLIKRPDQTQRQMIMGGCVAFAKLNGPAKVEAELLPQIWEQIGHKYYERRLLVAESCGILAPHIPPELRSSLVLSILQQMLQDDKGESVRDAVVKSLGILVAFIDDEDKFKQCWELLLRALNDSSQIVSTAALTVLLPALAAWSYELGRFESDVISYFLSQLSTCIKQVSRLEGESGATERSQTHLVTLTHLVPWHYASILLSGPYVENIDTAEVQPKHVQFPHPFSRLLDIRVIIGDNSRLDKLVAEMEKEIATEVWSSWKKLRWFQEECLASLIKATETLGFSQPEILHSLTILLSVYCSYFGHLCTHKMIKPHFKSLLFTHGLNQTGIDGEQSKITTAIFPLFVAGVLASFKEDEEELVQCLQDAIVNLALSYISIDSLSATFIELKREKRLHSLLIRILDELSGHSAVQVRRYTATLLGLLITDVDEKLVTRHVVKILLKLSKDSEIAVKIETIGSLGTIMEIVSKRDVLNQVRSQFEYFVQDEETKEDFLMYSSVLKTLAKITPNADPVFRDEFVIPLLTEAALQNNNAPNRTQCRDIATVLLEAYRGLSGCFISGELLMKYLYPGLKALLEDCEVVGMDNVPIKQLLKDVHEKIIAHQKQSSNDLTGKEQSSGLLSKFKDMEFTSPRMSFSFKKKS